MKYIIIGLGNYGGVLAEELSVLGHEVIGVDTNEHRVDVLKDKIATSFIIDATDEQSLSVLPLKDVDVVIVAIGENFGASVRVVALLKKKGVKHIYARAVDDVHKTEQIPSDFYRKGETARAVVARVDNKNNNPKIILSRTSPVFLQRLFEMEVPEINDGLITIKKIARIPGERAKIAVESYDDRIDPVGACVGVKGSRIHGIVRELRNENIDVINYTSNISLFIQRALSPAKISSIRLNEEEKKAEVFLKPEEVSLAIGKGGLNIKLASMLTEYTIDVFRELDENVADEDIYLDEFRDEIDGWVIDAIKAIGIDTAKAVLNAPREMLIEKTDLEEETVDEVIRILKSEFEEEPAAEMEPETEAEPEAEPTQE
jgi:N utilization substance protein A